MMAFDALGSSGLVAFVPTRDPGRARRFYEGTLGLRFVSADQFALVFTSHGTTIRIADVSAVPEFQPASFTILGWQVADAERAVRELAGRGVTFERYPGMDQDAAGIWRSPSGARVAWFKDPDGNILSITQS
jgi:catechol 2,3-dioxygenase-like lactoylglutathione lyase family enzyme